MGCVSKTLQGLYYRHLNFLFSENLEQSSKRSDLKTKNGIDVQFAPKWFVKYDESNVKKCFEIEN